MAPAPQRKPIPKEKISALFAQAKTQSYYDPAARGPGTHTIRTIAWSPTGQLIATGSVNRTLRIWNPDKPQVKHSTELKGHTGGIERVAWNPAKEAELASVSTDGTCKFWDVRSRTCIQTVQLGGEGLSIAWASDGSMVMVGRKDDVLVPISVPSYIVHPHAPQMQQTNQIVFAPLLAGSTAHTLLLTTGSGTIKICSYPLNPASSSSSTSLEGNSPEESGSGQQAVSAGAGAPAPELKLLHVLNSHTSSCFCLELSSTGRWLATGGSDALICLWDTGEWVCRRSLDRMAGAVRGLGFSWDGAYVVGSSDEGSSLEIAHAESGDYVHTVHTSGPAPCIAWHPSRYWLAYSGDTGGLRIVGAAGGGL